MNRETKKKIVWYGWGVISTIGIISMIADLFVKEQQEQKLIMFAVLVVSGFLCFWIIKSASDNF